MEKLVGRTQEENIIIIHNALPSPCPREHWKASPAAQPAIAYQAINHQQKYQSAVIGNMTSWVNQTRTTQVNSVGLIYKSTCYRRWRTEHSLARCHWYYAHTSCLDLFLSCLKTLLNRMRITFCLWENFLRFYLGFIKSQVSYYKK